jgi:peptide deformylase
VPGIFEPVKRAEIITVQALNQEGQETIFTATELLAVCIQHEMDHLQGKLFVDYLSPLKRQRIRKKLEKQKKDE